MSSFIMSKAEIAALFDVIGADGIPTGVRGLQESDEHEYKAVLQKMTDSHLVAIEENKIRMNQGLELFFLPILQAEAIMLFNYGFQGVCTFNVTLYFAPCGLAAVLDRNESGVKVLTIDSFEDLQLLLPEISHVLEENREAYVSYIIFERDSSTLHGTELHYKENRAKIAEGKRYLDGRVEEAEFETDISDYETLLFEKLKEVYHAAGC